MDRLNNNSLFQLIKSIPLRDERKYSIKYFIIQIDCEMSIKLKEYICRGRFFLKYMTSGSKSKVAVKFKVNS